MAQKTRPPKTHPGSTPSGRKTVGVYHRPPQKRSLKPMLIALVIALALVLMIVFARLSHGSPAEAPWGGSVIGVDSFLLTDNAGGVEKRAFR